jgi:hypothetical protein
VKLKGDKYVAGYLSHAIQFFEDACLEIGGDDPTKLIGNLHVTILYGVAAITLDAARADRGLTIPPDPIVDERDQFVALAYSLRCAPAHDIAMPKWEINNRFRRVFKVGPVTIDLSAVHGTAFDFAHIGGPKNLIELARYAQAQGWA